jgi:hypothetical protein
MSQSSGLILMRTLGIESTIMSNDAMTNLTSGERAQPMNQGANTYRIAFCLVALGLAGCPGSTTVATTKEEKSAAKIGPRLEIKQTRYDAGEADYAVTRECKFPVRNAGDQPLALTLVSKSCICTEATMPSEMAPGQEDAVVLRWTPLPGHVGPHHILCVIDSNDKTKPSVTLEVSGNINPTIRIAPEDQASIDFYRLSPGDVKPRELKVFSTKLKSFDLEAKTDLPGLKITKTKMELDASSRISSVRPTCAYSVVVETTPQLPPGYFTGNLVLTVKPPDEAARDIPLHIYGEVANGLFKVLPDEVEFKKPKLAEGDVQLVRVQFFDTTKKQTLKIVKVEPAFLHYEEPSLLPKSPGQWQFRVQILPKNPEAAKVQPNNFFEGRIVLQASGSDAQIPVRVKWAPPEPAEKR